LHSWQRKICLSTETMKKTTITAIPKKPYRKLLPAAFSYNKQNTGRTLCGEIRKEFSRYLPLSGSGGRPCNSGGNVV
jgi:hypothetical protein